jgi:hypothetical protein
MNKEQRIVYIKVVAPTRLLPTDVLEEVTHSIGSKFDRGTKGVLMGLNFEERRAILPAVIKVDHTDSVHWIKAVKEFYCDLTIRVPYASGLELNISTTKVKHKAIDGEEILIDYPTSPKDYIMYKQCLVDDSVANEKSLVNEGTYSFYIEDQAQDMLRRSMNTKNTIKIDKIFNNLVELDDNDNYKNQKAIKFVCMVLGKNPNIESMDSLVDYLKDLKNEAVKGS